MRSLFIAINETNAAMTMASAIRITAMRPYLVLLSVSVIRCAADKVFDIIIENWLSKLTREQVVFMLNAVSELDYNAQLSFEKSHSITPKQILNVWNKTHQEAENIYMMPEFES